MKIVIKRLNTKYIPLNPYNDISVVSDIFGEEKWLQSKTSSNFKGLLYLNKKLRFI